eukprot:451461-Prorocentrum_minimum.AAC.2
MHVIVGVPLGRGITSPHALKLPLDVRCSSCGRLKVLLVPLAERPNVCTHSNTRVATLGLQAIEANTVERSEPPARALGTSQGERTQAGRPATTTGRAASGFMGRLESEAPQLSSAIAERPRSALAATSRRGEVRDR